MISGFLAEQERPIKVVSLSYQGLGPRVKAEALPPRSGFIPQGIHARDQHNAIQCKGIGHLDHGM